MGCAFLPGDLNERWSVSVESIGSNKRNEGDRSITAHVHEGPCEADVATRLYEDPGLPQGLTASTPHCYLLNTSSPDHVRELTCVGSIARNTTSSCKSPSPNDRSNVV